MFFATNQYGLPALQASFDALPIDPAKKITAVAKFLDITDPTLSRWLSGKQDAPRAVCYALWHESPLGRSVTSAHSEQEIKILRGLLRATEAESIRKDQTIAALLAENAALKARPAAREQRPTYAANDPMVSYR